MHNPTDSNFLLFATTKLISNMVVNGDEIEGSIIIMDEAHHPSQEAIELLAYLKQLAAESYTRRAPFIIITSATIDIRRFASYFNTTNYVSVLGSTSEKVYRYPDRPLNSVTG